MPNRDGSGPEGNGPRTGRGMGNCAATEKTSNFPRRAFRTRGQNKAQGRRAQK